MYPSARRRAFTLIELLTVMAIITLLIGILTPALSNARAKAQTTAVRAQLNAMEVGLEAFRGDEDEYVPSNAALYANDLITPNPEMTAWEVGDTGNPLQGAHLLVDALIGRDFLGYDPRPGPIGAGSGNTYNRWDAANDRRQPYIPVDGVDVTSLDKPPEDAFGQHPTLSDSQPTIDVLVCRVFRDKFGWPILYYRASPTARQDTPIINTTGTPVAGDGVYDGVDNAVFTSYPTSAHKLEDPTNPAFGANDPMTLAAGTDVEILPNKFAEFIRSFRSTTYDITNPKLIKQARPVKADRFILLSAGKDGIYGNLDDVANFNVLSEER